MSERRRLLGVDTGTVRIGLAISDPDRIIASPLETYPKRNPEHDAEFFRKLIEAEQVGGFVIGLPLHMSGEEGEKAKEARRFGAWLTELTGLAAAYWDERLTTVAAEGYLLDAKMTNKQRRARRDRVAAQIMLQSYLDAGCPPGD